MKRALVVLMTVLFAMPLFAAKARVAPGGPKLPMSTPLLACAPASTGAAIDVTFTAGATGAPAGFSVQWMLVSDFVAAGGWTSDTTIAPSYCHASFSGNASGYYYNLGPGGQTTVTLGDVLFDTPGASSSCENVPLLCGEQYVFRAFAHATSNLGRSDWSADTFCSTLPCGGDGCTYTQGYWKTHGPIPTGNNVNEWPVIGLTLGTVAYTDFELQAIFDTPGSGNALITLAHQLIAAKLNVANGADDSAVASAIAAADALIGGLVVPPIGTGTLPNGSVGALITALTDYNEGATGPGHCD
jgi:hypothetical protein